MSNQFSLRGKDFNFKKKDHSKILYVMYLPTSLILRLPSEGSIFNYKPIFSLRMQPVEEPIQTKSTTTGDKECLKLMKYCDL